MDNDFVDMSGMSMYYQRDKIEVVAPCDYDIVVDLEEKVKELTGLINRLGSDLYDMDIQKDLLIAENNHLRGLMRECGELLEEYEHTFQSNHAAKAKVILECIGLAKV